MPISGIVTTCQPERAGETGDRGNDYSFKTRGLKITGGNCFRHGGGGKGEPKACPDNRQCLAGTGGCFTCLKQCPNEGINIAWEKGLIDSDPLHRMRLL